MCVFQEKKICPPSSKPDFVATIVRVFFFCDRSLFCYAVLCVLSSLKIISLGKRMLVALLLLSSVCHAAVIVFCCLVTWVGVVCGV